MTTTTETTVTRSEHWKTLHGIHWTNASELLKAGAYKSKPVSWASAMAILGDDATAFATDYLLECPIPVEWVVGDDIHEVFEKYRPGSCMRYSGCHDMRTLYSRNPKKVGCAYWRKGSHPALESDGSCLVWTGKTGAYVDRVYSNAWSAPASVIRAAIGKAISGLFEYPVKSIYSNDIGLDCAGKVTLHELKPPFEGLLPYSDTMRFSWDGESLSVSNKEGFEAKNTDGTTLDGDEHNQYECTHCGCGLHEDDTRHTDNGDGPYCENCYSELFAHCERYQCDYPADEVSETSFLWNGIVRTENVSNEWLSNKCYAYAGKLYADEITWIANDECTEIDGIGYVADEELQDTDCEEVSENAYYIDPYFGDACKLADAHWEPRIMGWLHNDTDDEFLDDYLRLCAMADCDPTSSDYPEFRVGRFYITNTRGDTRFRICHQYNGGGSISHSPYTLDDALAMLGWVVGHLDTYGIPELLTMTDYAQWSPEKGNQLRDLIHHYENRNKVGVLFQVSYPVTRIVRGYTHRDRAVTYVHAHGGVLAAYDALLRNLPVETRPALRECYFSVV